jgi:membrane-associated PAP2 superfamily phosphatase
VKAHRVAMGALAAGAADPTATPPAPWRLTQALRRDGPSTLAALLALLAWDASGADLAAVRLFGGAHGFAWRDSFWASTLLHDGGRIAAWVLLALLVAAALRAGAETALQPGPATRWRWIAVMLAGVVAVPALKRLSLTSCPWDLAEFGGVAHYVSHWVPGLSDGGAGHCFPSGHAVAAFAFLGLYFQWRDLNPRRARAWLLGVLATGLAFGGAQLVRGAHYPSHTLWTAWLCWALCAAAAAALDARRLRPS